MAHDNRDLGPHNWSRLAEQALFQALADREMRIIAHVAAALGYDLVAGLTRDQEDEVADIVDEALDSWRRAEAASSGGLRATTELQRLLEDYHEILGRIHEGRGGRR